jgi:hypothetical protein
MKVYKSTNVRDNKVFVQANDSTPVPGNLNKAVMIYHVFEVDPGEEDYTVLMATGGKLHYKFSSQKGREAFDANPNVVKTMSKESITCPDCLKAIGEESRLVFLDEEPIVVENLETEK